MWEKTKEKENKTKIGFSGHEYVCTCIGSAYMALLYAYVYFEYAYACREKAYAYTPETLTRKQQ